MDRTRLQKGVVWSAMVILAILSGARSVRACSIEIWSIDYVYADAPIIIAGQVTAVQEGPHPELVDEPEDVLQALLEDGFPVTIRESVTLEVTHVLKGEMALGPITVTLSPAFTDPFSSCYDGGFTYRVGDRVLFGVGEVREDNTYWGPMIAPGLLGLDGQVPVEEQILYQYVRYLGEHGSVPFKLRFEETGANVTGQNLGILLVADNQLTRPVQLYLGRPPASLHRVEQPTFVLEPSGIEARGEEVLGPFDIEPGEQLRLDLEPYFTAGSAGGHMWKGSMGLPTGPGRAYNDHWYTPGNGVYQLQVRTHSAVEASSWGQLKAAR
ncbi:MAG: hypothetical protein GKR89_15495 [Candidatus Latescibacteria bacterium]|nr:hypothetical protein [Candidatus Latescibacterota bacterium]